MNSILKIKLNGKRLYETNLVKYLGKRIDNKLKWKAHIEDTEIKLTTFININFLKIIFSPANISTTSYLLSLIVGLHFFSTFHISY